MAGLFFSLAEESEAVRLRGKPISLAAATRKFHSTLARQLGGTAERYQGCFAECVINCDCLSLSLIVCLFSHFGLLVHYPRHLSSMKVLRLSSCHSPSATQMAARRHLRKHLRRIREREYSKLRALVPAVATKKKVTKVQVIEEAVRYIEELHTALVERFRQKHGCEAESMAQETVRSFVNQMMPLSRPAGSLTTPDIPSATNTSTITSHHPHHPHNHHPSPSTHPYPHVALPLLPAPHPHASLAGAGPASGGGSAVPFPHPAVSYVMPPCPVPAFLSAAATTSGSSNFEKQRKRASFLLKKTRRDC